MNRVGKPDAENPHVRFDERDVETGPWLGQSGTAKRKRRLQTELQFIDENQPVKSWQYAVLVCNAEYALEHIGQLYRDRADCENGFDEIKNQWGRARTRSVLRTVRAWRGVRALRGRGLQGWGGYSTHDIERCALTARAVALIYNWWSWYVRLAHPKARMEGITSRPKLLAAVGKMTQHARVTKIVLALTHEAAAHIKALIANVREGLQTIRAIAPQLTPAQRWPALVQYIIDRIIACRRTPNELLTFVPTG